MTDCLRLHMGTDQLAIDKLDLGCVDTASCVL